MEDIELPVDISEVHSYDGVRDPLHDDSFAVVVVAGTFIYANDVADIKPSSLSIFIGVVIGLLVVIVMIVGVIVLMVMKACGRI